MTIEEAPAPGLENVTAVPMFVPNTVPRPTASEGLKYNTLFNLRV